MTIGQGSPALTVSPCNVTYNIKAPQTSSIQQILDQYLLGVFKCATLNPSTPVLTIVVRDPNQMVATNLDHEKYSLSLSNDRNWSLQADYHVGFLRGFETFSQLFEPVNGSYVIKGIPVQIDDAAQFIWRGILIDTSRHYLPVSSILKLIDGMLYNKLSVLHWHIVDEEGFPMVVTARPELHTAGQIDGIYTV